MSCICYSQEIKPTGRDPKEVPDGLTKQNLKERRIEWNGGRGTVETVRDEKHFFINLLHLPVEEV